MSRLHIVLCQFTQHQAEYESTIIQAIVNAFEGEVVPHYYQRGYRRWLTACERLALLVRTMWSTKRGEVIFLKGAGLIWLMLMSLVLRGRYIFFWNFIFYTNIHSFKNAFWCKLVQLANRFGGLYLTVNAPELQYVYEEVFGMDREHFPLIYDPMNLSEEEKSKSQEEKQERYVFCGGRARRDIACFERIVRQMADVKFVAVLPKEMVTLNLRSLPNLTIYCDIPVEDFYDKLSHATVCCIPLKSKEPCGLFVMQHAQLMGIPIVSTETYSMRVIVPDDTYGYLCQIGDDKTMTEKVRMLLVDTTLHKIISSKAQQLIERNFSQKAIARQMATAMRDIQKAIKK